MPDCSEARGICQPTRGALWKPVLMSDLTATSFSVGSFPKMPGSSEEMEAHRRRSRLWDQRSKGSEPDFQPTPPCPRMEASSTGPQFVPTQKWVILEIMRAELSKIKGALR